MSEPRLRFDSRMDAALTVWTAFWATFALFLMVAAIVGERYGLAAFNLLLILVNSAVIASVASRMDYR